MKALHVSSQVTDWPETFVKIPLKFTSRSSKSKPVQCLIDIKMHVSWTFWMICVFILMVVSSALFSVCSWACCYLHICPIYQSNQYSSYSYCTSVSLVNQLIISFQIKHVLSCVTLHFGKKKKPPFTCFLVQLLSKTCGLQTLPSTLPLLVGITTNNKNKRLFLLLYIRFHLLRYLR